ncbi:MAG: Ribose operon repressor [Planctomycetes bacterium ADurb.Bin401]|nr:MAG: Ribose operon repressor [Planctomycetes bacterium ADurb.Bin401]
MTIMADVAAEAGLSRYTVSKVLNGVYVSEKSRQKVLEACKKLHYRRNLYATNLVRNKSFTIGMVISQSYDSFFGEIINAAEKEAHANGYQLICQCSYGDTQKENKIIMNFESLKICGLIVAPVVSDSQPEQWTVLEERFPVINFDCYLKQDSNYVINDNWLSGKLVTEHLISRGRVPAYLGSVHPDNNLAIKKRKKGYTDTMKKYGLQPQIIPTTNSSETMDNQQFGYDNFISYLNKHALPEALFCATDRIAMGAIFALQERGIRVGRDIIVAGHDDLEFGAYMSPTLTTVAQPKQEMGAECVRSLLDLMQNNKSQKKYVQKVLRPELIIRQSTMGGID